MKSGFGLTFKWKKAARKGGGKRKKEKIDELLNWEERMNCIS